MSRTATILTFRARLVKWLRDFYKANYSVRKGPTSISCQCVHCGKCFYFPYKRLVVESQAQVLDYHHDRCGPQKRGDYR